MSDCSISDPQQGPPPRELIDERLHPEDRERVHSVRADAVRDKADREHEYRIVLRDGALRYVQATWHPVLNPAGEMVEVLGTVRDVKERKHAEHALQETQAALAHVTRMTTLGEVIASSASPCAPSPSTSTTSSVTSSPWCATSGNGPKSRSGPVSRTICPPFRRIAFSCSRSC
jgi:hypothetical protein